MFYSTVFLRCKRFFVAIWVLLHTEKYYSERIKAYKYEQEDRQQNDAVSVLM